MQTLDFKILNHQNKALLFAIYISVQRRWLLLPRLKKENRFLNTELDIDVLPEHKQIFIPRQFDKSVFVYKMNGKFGFYKNLNHISLMLCLHKGLRFSSKDFQSVWSWFVDFIDYALEFFGIYAIPSSVHLLVSNST